MDPAKTGMSNIAASGLLGALCVILMVVIAVLMLRAWKKDDDHKNEILKLTNDCKKELLEIAAERTGDVQAAAKELRQAAVDSATTLLNATNTLVAVKEGLNDLRDEMRLVVDELRARNRNPKE